MWLPEQDSLPQVLHLSHIPRFIRSAWDQTWWQSASVWLPYHRFRFLRKASGFPERCIYKIKFNVLSLVLSFFQLFHVTKRFLVNSSSNILLWSSKIYYYFFFNSTLLILVEVSFVYLLKRVNIPLFQFFSSFTQTVKLSVKLINGWILWKSPLCWTHGRHELELTCAKRKIIS